MPDIGFSCDGCGQPLEAPPEMAGDTVECPSCGRELVVPGADRDADEAPSSPANACPECGAAMEEEAVLCVQCGFHTGLGRKLDTEIA
ncbi:MAG: hypothetical protein FJ225_06485 [Lentisphaerae bacterium]|nr:hypothetical protein [Lentisphaerota bacterium]